MKSIKIVYKTIIFLSFFLLPLFSFQKNTSLSTRVPDKNPLKILTPSLKNVETRKLILSNDIKVMLISDSEARASSAAVAVDVGSWHDDPRFPGMAHFCEHMLFMGSKKYPDENAFWQFVLDNSGMCNAYTAPDRTVYMFSINNEKLDKGLDMFSRFFIDPLFSENSIDRELLAVNQEHNKNIEHDGWRSWFIFKQEGNQNHENRKFSTGTEETLKVIGRDNLEKWYKEHYKSNGMHLVVYSNKDIDTLTQMVERSFSEVEPAKSTNPPIPYARLSSPSQEGHITYIEPVKDIKELSISWEIPPAYANDMDKKTYSLIAYALSHHMKGGLYFQLKKEGLIEDLSADCDRISKDHVILTITMDLTNEGMQKTDHILYTFYGALNKLKKGNVPAHIYYDMEAVLSTSYKWQSRKDPFSTTMEYAAGMVNEDLETFPYKTMTITEFDQKNSRDLLSFLSPQNALYKIIGKKEDTHRAATNTEPWTGAKYSVSKIGDDILSSWNAAPPHKEITLPNPNPYISKHQKLLSEEVVEKISSPSLIAEEEAGKCFFWQDSHYLVPKTQISMRIKSPEINSSAKSLCMNDLFASYLSYHMASLISEGSFADINTSIYADQLGLNISVNGYHDKIGSYMMAFLSNLTASYPTKKEFNLIKEQMLSECRSARCSLPYAQGFDLLSSIITNTHLDNKSREQALESVSIEDFQEFQKNLLEENYLNVFICGNIDKENALLHYTEIKNTLSSKVYNPHTHHAPSYIPFYGDNPRPQKVIMDTPMGGSAAILLIDQGKYSFDNYAAQSVFGTIIKEAFFAELRSKQQTGYITSSKQSSVRDQLVQYFVVQSTTHYPEELLARFELFLEDYSRNMETNISKDRFNMIKKAMIADLKIPTENLASFARMYFELAYTYNGDFKRNEKIISSLENLSYDDFIKESKKCITRENTKRLAILVNGNQIDKKAFSYTETNAKELASIKRSL